MTALLASSMLTTSLRLVRPGNRGVHSSQVAVGASAAWCAASPGPAMGSAGDSELACLQEAIIQQCHAGTCNVLIAASDGAGSAGNG